MSIAELEPPTFTIRHAIAADLPRIIEIHMQSLPPNAGDSPSLMEWKNWDAWWDKHSPHQHPLWVHEEDERVVGWISLTPLYRRKEFRGSAQISLYVASEAQRRGIGTRLVRQSMAACPALGIRTVLAFVLGHNIASLKTFQRAGLELWGHFPGSAKAQADDVDTVMLGRTLDHGIPCQ